jgi:hypothetical protein
MDYIFKHGFQVNCWMSLGKDLSHALIFIQNFRGDDQLDFSIPACLENLKWWPTKKDPRNKHVCVENYFH